MKGRRQCAVGAPFRKQRPRKPRRSHQHFDLMKKGLKIRVENILGIWIESEGVHIFQFFSASFQSLFLLYFYMGAAQHKQQQARCSRRWEYVLLMLDSAQHKILLSILIASKRICGDLFSSCSVVSFFVCFYQTNFSWWWFWADVNGGAALITCSKKWNNH